MKSASKTERKNYLDIAKGIGIILVVWAHANGPGSRYINLFHMPMFFFISGLLFNEKDTCEQYIIKKFKTLYIPFLFWNIVIYLIEYTLKVNLENKEFQLNAYLNVVFQIEAGVNKSTFLGATWFLAALFWVSVLYKCLYGFLRRHLFYAAILMTVICSIFTIIALNITIPYFISRTVICSLFYSLGVSCKNLMEQILSASWKYYFAIALFAAFFLMNKDNTANMGQNIYANKLYFLLGAFIVSISIIILCYGIEEKLWEIGKWVLVFGVNSMEIVIWQFVAFIPIFFIQCIQNQVGVVECVGLLLTKHTYDTSSFWWILYLIAGVGIPLLLRLILQNTKVMKVLKSLYLVR